MRDALRFKNNVKCSSALLQDLKTAVGELHYPFMGFRQHISHEFLLLMFNLPKHYCQASQKVSWPTIMSNYQATKVGRPIWVPRY